MPDLPVPEAAVRAVQQIPGSPRGIAGLYEEEIRDILTAAAPHIGAAHIRRAESAEAERDRLAAQIAEVRRIVTDRPDLPDPSDVAYFHMVIGQHVMASQVHQAIDTQETDRA